MRYQEYSRGTPLARWVQCYWVLEGTPEGADVIVPDGRMELVFTTASPSAGCTRTGARSNSRAAFWWDSTGWRWDWNRGRP